MAGKRDYYEVLGLGKTAGGDEVKRAYRRLALKFHPDNYKGDKAEAETKFKELAEAYEVLSDPAKRQCYDRYGHEGLRGAGMHDFSSMGFGDIFSMFEDIFGGMPGVGSKRRRGPRRGYDLEAEVTLSLEELATGVDKTLEFERNDYCKHCSGSGAKPGTQPKPCPTCGGHGQVQQAMQGFFGTGVRITPCPVCHGRGNRIETKCPKCNGTGRQRTNRVLTVHVPAGVHEGQAVRLRGEGEPGDNGAERGDLHCYVRVRQHPLLGRDGNNLICQVPISYTQAALGGQVDVPTLSGTELMDIPAGTQHGEVFTLRKRGLPDIRTGRPGHELVQVVIEVPRKLTKKQEELLNQLAQTEEKDSHPAKKSFMDKLAAYFGTREKKS
ncbi:MAG: molecular chaperone DnaJ [Planctomycetes bacterium]|nr:molecular chaperone DnaJ [Planctomycetota bacterium]